MIRYFFIHCAKTGGTSLNNQLRTIFSEQETYPTKAEKRANFGAITNLDDLKKSLESRPDVRFVTGHFPYWAKDIIGLDVKTFTLLREPVARTLSALRFDKKMYRKDMTLEQIYDHPMRFRFRFQNPMVKLFSLDPTSQPEGLLQFVDFTEDHLKKARQNLRKIDVVGLTEDYENFCTDLEKTFSWDLGRIRHDNQTEKDPVSPAFINRIKRDNLLDIRLYRAAQKIIETRRRRQAR